MTVPPHPKARVRVAEKRGRRDESFARHLRRRLSNLSTLLYPVVGWIILAWVWTVNRCAKIDRRGAAFEMIRDGKPYIFTFWHEDCLPLMFEMSRGLRKSPHMFMVSPGRTGALGSYLLTLFNTQSIAGSGSNKGVHAVRRLTRRFHREPASIYILADGSRGPNHEMRWGALYLARDTGLPIIAGRAWSNSLIRLAWTWMGLALPLPWGRTVVLTSEPLYIPEDADREQLEAHRAELQRRLDVLTQASLDYFEKGEAAAGAFGPPWTEFPEPPAGRATAGGDAILRSCAPEPDPEASGQAQ